MSEALERGIAEWRGAVDRARAIEPAEADELESHLREQIDDLREAGLDPEEAFLIGVRRLGAVDAISREFARTSSGRMWKQLVAPAPDPVAGRSNGLVSALLIGLVAAAVLQVLRITTIGSLGDPDGSLRSADPLPLLRNAGLIPIAAVAAWLLWHRRPGRRIVLAVATAFVALALIANLFPFGPLFGGPDPSGQTALVLAIHLPVAAWLLVGLAYTADRWRSTQRRMDFVRFTGEGLVYYILIALGGWVVFLLAAAILAPVLRDFIPILAEWGVVSGPVVAFPLAAWLVEQKQAVIENIAPVLSRVFTPLVAAVAVAGAGVYLAVGLSRPFDRELMIVFDALLVVVLGLVLYNLSARTESRAARFFDAATLVAVVGALVLDALVLADLVARIGDLGWTPNRIAAIGLNLILVVVLAVAAVLSALHVARRAPIARLEGWLMATLPAYSIWAGVMVLVIPPAFGFR